MTDSKEKAMLDWPMKVYQYARKMLRTFIGYDSDIGDMLTDIKYLSDRVRRAEDRIGEHTTVHADIHFKKPHQIIVVGRYRNQDYVRVFDMDEPDFVHLIERLKFIEKNSKVGRFDMVGGMSISAVYERDRF
jgi:hypothetical protein